MANSNFRKHHRQTCDVCAANSGSRNYRYSDWILHWPVIGLHRWNCSSKNQRKAGSAWFLFNSFWHHDDLLVGVFHSCKHISVALLHKSQYNNTIELSLQTNWRLISGIACGISVVATLLLIFIPESPNWLASKGRINEAEQSLRLFKGLPRVGSFTNPELAQEIKFLNHQSLVRKEQTETLMEKLTKPEVYKPLGIMIGLFAFQQFCGIFVVIVYAVSFSQAAGVRMDPFLCTVLIGAARLVASFSIMFILDSVGRRLPTMISGLAMAVCMFSLMVYTNYFADTLTWLPVTLILLFVLFSSIGR